MLLMQFFALYFFVSTASFSLAMERKYEREHAAAIDQYPAPQSSPGFIRESIRAGVTIVLLITEGIVLWRIRKRTYNRFLAAGYILPLAAVLVVFPLMAIRMNILFDLLVPNPLLYWIGIGIAHVFLAIMVWQARRRNASPSAGFEKNILDDFAERQ